MTIQMLFNPNILEFWQVLMGMQRDSFVSQSPSPVAATDSISSQSLRSQFITNARRQHPDSIVINKRPTQGKFDKLAIPLGFEGKTFKELFTYLLNKYGTIALGLYR